MIHSQAAFTDNEEQIAQRAVRWWILNIILGIILFVAPWYSVMWMTDAPAWNTWIFSAIIIGISLYEVVTGGRALAGILNVLVGIWLFIAPWLLGYGYMNGIAWSNWAAGVLVSAVTLWALWQIKVVTGRIL